jgi:hypothetical protein
VTVISRVETRNVAPTRPTDIIADLFRGLKTAWYNQGVSDTKKKDIKAMLKYMPHTDKAYMSILAEN